MKNFYFVPILVMLCFWLPILVSCEDGISPEDELELFLDNFSGTWESTDGDFRITISTSFVSAQVTDGSESYSLTIAPSFPISGDVTMNYQSTEVFYSIHLERMTVPDKMDVTVKRTLGEGEPTSRSFTLLKLTV